MEEPRKLPDIRPRMQRPPAVGCDPQSYSLAPDPDRGPVALIMSVRLDNGEHITSLAEGAMIVALSTEDRGAVDLSMIGEDTLSEVALVGWPNEWSETHIGWGIVAALGQALDGGLSWESARQALMRRVMANRTAHLN